MWPNSSLETLLAVKLQLTKLQKKKAYPMQLKYELGATSNRA